MPNVHVRNVTWTLPTGYVSFSYRYIYCFVAIAAFHIFRCEASLLVGVSVVRNGQF